MERGASGHLYTQLHFKDFSLSSYAITFVWRQKQNETKKGIRRDKSKDMERTEKERDGEHGE